MAKRSITDEEIALIKAMLGRKMKNKDIQFFFNRPDRPVNSGRITGIRKGTYANSRSIAPASDERTQEFIAKFSAQGGAVVVAAAPQTPDHGPMSPEALKNLFEEVGVGLYWRLKAGETDEHECKTSFGFKHAHNWLKPMAALANNRGGYVLFGVYDKGKCADDGFDLSHVVCGINDTEFSKIDPVEFTKKVKATFDPTPRFTVGTVTVGGKIVGVIHVEQHASRPIIATRNDGEIREGDVYYRYVGQSSRIKYSDLRALLDERDRRARVDLWPMLERLMVLGPERAMIADLEAGTLGDGKQVIQIDEALLERVAFIKEGSFREQDGKPALRLVGDVRAVGAGDAVLKKGVVTRNDLINDFLGQTSVLDPKEYIRYALEGAQGDWLPLRFFARQAGLSKVALVGFINKTAAAVPRKTLFASRMSKKETARQTATGQSASMLKKIQAGATIPPPTSSKEAATIARAIIGLPKGTDVSLETLLTALQACVVRASGVDASVVRRALCRVDELFFEL